MAPLRRASRALPFDTIYSHHPNSKYHLSFILDLSFDPSSRESSSTPREFTQGRVDVACEAIDPDDRLAMAEESRLSHQQQMAVAADVFVVRFDLFENGIRVAGEHDTLRHRLLQREAAEVIDRALAQRLRRRLDRHVPGRHHE